LAQNASSVRELPLDQRAAFTTALRNYASGQLMVIAAGRRALEQAGKANVTDKQALATGEQMRLKFARSLHVQVDPRFGTFANGDLQSSEGSLSVAVSARAADGKTSDPSPQWLAGLPNAQKCL
jgi:hypothetical protein